MKSTQELMVWLPPIATQWIFQTLPKARFALTKMPLTTAPTTPTTPSLVPSAEFSLVTTIILITKIQMDHLVKHMTPLMDSQVCKDLFPLPSMAVIQALMKCLCGILPNYQFWPIYLKNMLYLIDTLLLTLVVLLLTECFGCQEPTWTALIQVVIYHLMPGLLKKQCLIKSKNQTKT